LFIGAWSENRQALIESIDFPMTVVGKRWERLGKTQHTVLAKNVGIQEVGDLYREHRFVLNVINTNNVRSGLNMRCFEAPACGAVLVSSKVADFDLVSGFENSLFFDRVENLETRLADYKAVADSVTFPHSYQDRLSSMIAELSECS
jgi:spore maturation protein CgeB